MVTLYTAMGKVEFRFDEQGRRYPIVTLGDKEYVVDIPEMIIWRSLNWELLDLSEVEKRYNENTHKYNIAAKMDFAAYISRLTQRGLIVSGMGDKPVDALYDILSELYIVPVVCGLFLKTVSFLKLTLIDRIPFHKAKTVFKEDTYTDNEKRVIDLARQALLSTAEIIKCVEFGVYDISDDIKVMEALYGDEETTCDNIIFIAKLFKVQQPVIEAVANLYLRKRIIFQRI